MDKVRVAIRVTEDGIPLMPEVRLGRIQDGIVLKPGEVEVVDKTLQVQRLLHPFQTLVELREGEEAPQPNQPAPEPPAESQPKSSRRRQKTAADL